jgi:hypothetical protein
MKKILILNLLLLMIGIIVTGCSDGPNNGLYPVMPPAGPSESQPVIFEDFENSADCWAWNSGDSMTITTENYHPAPVTDPHVPVKNHSLRLIAKANWGGGGIQPGDHSWDIDLNPAGNNTKLSFWVYGIPDDGNTSGVGIEIWDVHSNSVKGLWTNNYGANNIFTPNQWTKLWVLLPDDGSVDLHHINKIQVQVYCSGTYYFDDMIAEP